MTGVKSLFTEEELAFMETSIGLELSDDKDYSTDELLDIHVFITDELPYEYDEDGFPEKKGQLFESIVHTTLDCFGI